MTHAHAHAHAHGAGDRAGGSARELSLVLKLVTAYMAAEIAGGILAHSLALLADAAHMLTDAASIGLALFATRMAGRRPTSLHTFGFHRAEILAALVNALAIGGITVFIFVEAWQRFLHRPPDISGAWVSAVATGGLAVNLASLRILHADSQSSLNVRAARLHVFMDTLGSVGAMVAGVLIWAFHWDWVDAAISVLIGILVLRSAWVLMVESVAVLMERAPGHVDVDQVRAALLQVPGVASMHDLHVWTITSRMTALSAHVVPLEQANHGDILRAIEEALHHLGIDHVTIQIETEAHGSAHGERCPV